LLARGLVPLLPGLGFGSLRDLQPLGERCGASRVLVEYEEPCTDGFRCFSGFDRGGGGSGGGGGFRAGGGGGGGLLILLVFSG
jgi:hypothetical protein